MRRGLRFPLSVVLVLACLNTGRVVKTFDCRVPTGIVFFSVGLPDGHLLGGERSRCPFPLSFGSFCSVYSSAHDTHEFRKGYPTRCYVDVNGAVTQCGACGDLNCTVKRHGFAARDPVNHVTSAIRSPSKLPVEVLTQACRCMLFCGIVSSGWPRLLVFPGWYASSSSTPSFSCGPLQRPLAFPEVEERWR